MTDRPVVDWLHTHLAHLNFVSFFFVPHAHLPTSVIISGGDNDDEDDGGVCGRCRSHELANSKLFGFSLSIGFFSHLLRGVFVNACCLLVCLCVSVCNHVGGFYGFNAWFFS